MKKILVVSNPKKLDWKLDDVEIVSLRDYLSLPRFSTLKNVRVFNFSDEYRYRSRGYYVSLMAEARGHKPLPNVKNIMDVKAPVVMKAFSDEIDELIQKTLKGQNTNEDFSLSIYFGRNPDKRYDKLCQQIYLMFGIPLLRARMVYNRKWMLQTIKTIPFGEVPDHHREIVKQFAVGYFGKKRYGHLEPEHHRYDLAILVQPGEKSAPSCKRALNRFAEAAEKQGFGVEFITKDDYTRLSEFDALLIRETTAVNHHTYRFARKAQAEGIAVIDEPHSILKCSNKVYLAELLKLNKIPTPKTAIIQAENKATAAQLMGLPCVLKIPDSSFSMGVKKVETQAELDLMLGQMLQTSDLVIAQEFTPTAFDWRIGVLDGTAIFACKYYMAEGHWQIYNWSAGSPDDVLGRYETVPFEQTPNYIIQLAEKATQLIGPGLYGVDIKDVNGKPLIIEINDNPNIDAGVEDKILGRNLYNLIINALKQRIEKNEQLLNPTRLLNHNNHITKGRTIELKTNAPSGEEAFLVNE